MLKLFGWKLVEGIPPDKKFVGLVAPHTSNWDFIWGQLAIIGLGQKGNVFMKRELFFFPLAPIFRALGGKPIDRKKSRSVLKQVIAYFRSEEHFTLFLTPEGTRSKNHRWKTGFHFIASHAGVPVYLTFIDYKTKKIGFLGKFEISDNAVADVNRLKQAYADINPKKPDQFSTQPQ